jgi:hypothetical protein
VNNGFFLLWSSKFKVFVLRNPSTAEAGKLRVDVEEQFCEM